MPPHHHRTVDRVTAILEMVAPVSQGLSLPHIAERLGAAKSSIQELVNGLVATGYLVERERRFGLGPAPFMLTLTSNPVAAQQIDRELLRQVHDEVGCSTLIGIQMGMSLVFVDQIGDEPALEFAARNHSRRSLFATAAGKAILAGLPVREMDALLLSASPAEQTDVDRFLDELAEIRTSGLAYNAGRTIPNVHAVATALRSADGVLVGAVCALGRGEVKNSLADIGHRMQKVLKTRTAGPRREDTAR